MKCLITGSSSGIGKSIAKYLNNENNEIILVSSNKEKLEKVQSSIKNSKIYVCDLSKEKEVDKLCEYILKEKPDFVVNNAGFGAFGLYDEITLEKELEMINVNLISLHKITKTCLKYMEDGYILNVSSSAGLMPAGPILNTYYATKNYVRSYSIGIYKELKMKRKNIHISILCPGPVNTNFNKVALGTFSIKGLNSDYVAKYAVDKTFQNKLIIIPGITVKLGVFFSRLLPTKLLISILAKIQHRKISKKLV